MSGYDARSFCDNTLTKYESGSFRIKLNTIVLTVWHLILNQKDIRLDNIYFFQFQNASTAIYLCSLNKKTKDVPVRW